MATRKHSQLIDFLTRHYNEFSQENSERLKALYSDFSKLSILNKYAYDANVNFWRQVILNCNQQGYLGCSEYATAINKYDLPEKFQRAVIGRPLALDCVLVCTIEIHYTMYIYILTHILYIKGQYGKARRIDAFTNI